MQKAAISARAERVILLSPTGSGKTLAFAVPLISRLRPSDGKVQAVVIAPSRELVLQIAEVIRPIAYGNDDAAGSHDQFKTVALYGGHNMQEEIQSLSVTPDIVVATPGRLLDHILRGSIDVSDASALVLDEYDKALELGFHDQMRRIVKRMRRLRYVMLTSATPLAEMPDFIDMSQAKVIDYSERGEAPRSRIEVMQAVSDDKDKLQALDSLLGQMPREKTIVFVNHRESAERVYNFLKKQGYAAGLYHGGMDQLKREVAIDMMNNGTTPVLVSTDLGSRGLDIDHVGNIVHYHLPPTPESWTHRNGRTARVDAEGRVYVLTGPQEKLPDYIDIDRQVELVADGKSDPWRSDTATIYFNVGKKEKLSRGDILGFLTKIAGLQGSEVGKIALKDHAALAAVPASQAQAVIAAAKDNKIKGMRVKASSLAH